MVRTVRKTFEISSCSRFKKKIAMSQCKLRLLEPLKQPHLGVRSTYSLVTRIVTRVRPCLWSNLSFCIHVQPR